MNSEKKEECGLIAVVEPEHTNKKNKKKTSSPQSYSFTGGNAAGMVGNMLQSLQHRGEEAAGIVYRDQRSLQLLSGLGHVDKAFQHVDFNRLPTNLMAIGHTRYSVTGVNNTKNIQPILVNRMQGSFAVAHNGNLINFYKLKRQLEKRGAIFTTDMDTEIFVHLITLSKKPTFKEAVIDAVKQVRGAFSLLIINREEVLAIRDPHGIRPFCWGKKGKNVVIASETCALDLVEAKYLGQIHAGEMLTVKQNGNISILNYLTGKEDSPNKRDHLPKNTSKEYKCIFEMVYFSRPDSMVFGESVYRFRRLSGKILAKESPVDADLIIPIPDSGVVAALGFAEELNIPMEIALTRNHYIGRSFIQPTQETRDQTVRMKLNPIKNLINNKRVILIDDSIVRGTTTKRKIETIRAAGATEIHLRIASPPIKYGCYYGIDFPDEKKLIANQKSLKEIERFLKVDSISYLSIPGLIEASKQNGFCTACFSGKYPIGKPKEFNKDPLALPTNS